MRLQHMIPTVMGGSSSYINTVLGTNPIAYWPLNEASGTTAVCQVNSNQNGTYGRDVSTMGTEPGPVGDYTAPTFTDTASDYVDIDTATLVSNFDGDEGALSAWAKVSGAAEWTDGDKDIVLYLNKGTANIIECAEIADRKMHLFMRANNVSKSSVKQQFDSTDWFHMAIVWSRSGDYLRTYINGLLLYQNVFSSLGAWSGADFDNALIGAGNKTGGSVWSGAIAHVALWSSPITHAQVAALANKTASRNILFGVTRSNTASALTTPTYDASGQATHPDVIDFGSGNTWNGYRYWMAMTPFPNGDTDFENPSILVSADGETWSDPGTNPVVAAPATGYNSDVDIFMEAGGITTMWMVYRELDGSNVETIYALSSTDGTTWSSSTAIVENGALREMLSPAVVYLDGTYRMWTVDATTTPHTLRLRTSSSPNSGWSAPSACVLTLPDSDLEIWHVDVNYRSDLGEYHMLVNSENTINDSGRLFFAWSTDGVNWTVTDGALLEPDLAGWDATYLYRSSWVYTGSNYDLFYAGIATTTWHIGRTTVTGL